MTDPEPTQQLQPGKPAGYRITVEGSLSDKWADRLGGMQIVVQPRENQKAITTLRGRVRDQAALFGVLNSLYELHLKILSVECTPDGEQTSPHTPS